MTTATLFAPKVRYTSTFESQFDMMNTWRAELELSYLDDDGDAPDVLAGYADFLIIRVGEHPIDDLLDSISEDASHFAELFDKDDVAAAVQEQFDDAPFNRILIITLVTVGPSLRRHGLGAWLVAELIDRMASPTDTLVLLYPYPVGPQTDKASELAAVNALSSYWQRVGLQPIAAQPQILGQATAYSHLPNARAELNAATAHVKITVPTSQIHAEQPDAYPRHTAITNPEPQRLRLVRD
ncbi:GNAT family N-acetyltransferase [Mycolicibacterium fortuitum]